MLYLKLLLAIALGAVIALLTGCAPQKQHPNQLSAFDGASYDSLTVAHAALVSLRATVQSTYPQYVPAFNQAAGAYSTAYNAYTIYRTMPADQNAAAIAISNLTVSIVNLENTLQSDMHVQPAAVAQVRGRAIRMRAAAAPRITITDVLTELEIAASIAQTVPGTQPYSTIAAIVIKTTQEAVTAYQASAGQLINLSTIQPVPAI